MSDIAELLANKLKNKAAELNMASSSGLQEWALKFVPQFLYRGMCQLHTKLCDIGDDIRMHRGQKILVIAPRGNAKSTWCSMALPLKAVCEGSEKYILLIADTAAQAKAYLKTISMELKHNELLAKAYPLACQEGETWTLDRIETANGVCIEALGKGNNVRGRKFKQYRPTLIIVDDPQNDEDILSPSTRAKDMEWFDKALIPAGDTDTNYLCIGTMLHRECIVGVLSNRPDFSVVKFASIMQWPKNMELWVEWARIYNSGGENCGVLCKEFYKTNRDLMHEGAAVLWEEKENLYTLMEMRENLGHQAFASEKQNDPRDPSKCEFPEAYFEGTSYEYIPSGKMKYSFGYCDPALGGQTKKHDFAAIIMGDYFPDENLLYIECDIKRRPVNATIDAMIEWHRLKHFEIFGIESNGFQSLMQNELLAKSPLFPVLPVENQGVHKNTRISRLGIWLQRKFFRFKIADPDTALLLQQLKDHPHADHDDGPDGLEGLLRIVTNSIEIGVGDDVDVIMDDGLGDNLFR